MSTTHGVYISQSPLEMLKLTRAEATQLPEEVLRQCRDYACPELSLEEFIAWSKVHGRCFFSIPAWMEYLRAFDFIIGTRIHGVVLALQAGVPAMCIAHDSRTLELCKVMLVPHVQAKDVHRGIARDDLLCLFQFDPAEFDKNRVMLAKRYIDFLRGNGLEASENQLGRIAAGAEPGR